MDWPTVVKFLGQKLSFKYLCYQIHGVTHPLSMESLRSVQKQLQGYEPDTKNLVACLDVALRNFKQEPRCVKENATVLIKSDGVELKFSCGNQKCLICIDDAGGDLSYNASELSGDVFLSRLCCRPQPLNVASLQGVKESLEKWEMGEDLRRCLKLALKEFPKEPLLVQENARLIIRKRKVQLEFISGTGQCEISVCFDKGEPRYEVEPKTWKMYRERLPLHKEHLNAKNLERIRRTVRSLEGTPPDVRKSLNIALDRFCQEPEHVKKNARMVIEVEGGEMELISGTGENSIDVSCVGGEVSYRCSRQTPRHRKGAQSRQARGHHLQRYQPYPRYQHNYHLRSIRLSH